ncbi:MAG: hypothetical protein PHY28_07630 [Dehalococcoidales bacterium]|nr:hypothetical protein [Dehalococcoidales bacterium]
MKRCMGMIVALVGVASLVLGIIFIVQAGSARQEVADSIAPLKISEVNAKYDAVKAKQAQLMSAEEPKIQAGQAQPSAMYNYLTVQKVGLGLTRTNIGVAGFLQTSGIIDIILGIGLLLAGMAMLKKTTT